MAPPPASDAVTTYNFEDFGADPGPDGDPVANIIAINAAIKWSADNRQPVYGLGKTYLIGPGEAPDNRIKLESFSHVICFASCRFSRAWDSGSGGVLVGADPLIQDATWEGGTFFAELDALGVRYKGTTVKLAGRRLTLIDVTVDGVNAGRGFALRGDDIRVFNPKVTRPTAEDSGGIRFTAGTGFRCFGGNVESGGDAALQFSWASEPDDFTDIIDGAYIGTRASSATGRALLVGTSGGNIRNVRFDGVSGEGGVGGNAISVQTILPDEPTNPVAAGKIENVTFRDVEVSGKGSAVNDTVKILVTSQGYIFGITFDNLTIRNPAGIAFRSSAPVGKIKNVRWNGGSVLSGKPGYPVIQLDGVTNAIVNSVWLEHATNGVVISVGATVGCSSVVLSDVSISGMLTGGTGLKLDLATNCGWSRGAIAGAIGAKAADLTTQALSCYVEDVDMSGLATVEPKVLVASYASAHRIQRNYQGKQTIRGLITGARTNALIVSGAINASGTFLTVSGEATLTTINGGEEGDTIVLGVQASSSAVSVTEAVNIKLAGTAGVVLNHQADTLTLIKRQGDWQQIGQADNA